MKEKNLYEQPSMIIIELSGKVGFMENLSGRVEVREQKGNFDNNDWETE